MEPDLKGGLIREGVSNRGGSWSLPCLGFKENVCYLLFGDILSKQLVLGAVIELKIPIILSVHLKPLKQGSEAKSLTY